MDYKNDFHSIFPDNAYHGIKYDKKVYCILGSCVGVVIISNDKISITHGTKPETITKQIITELEKFSGDCNIYLCGGGTSLETTPIGAVGERNITAAKEVLKNHKYKDLSGKTCVIRVEDGEIKITINKTKVLKLI